MFDKPVVLSGSRDILTDITVPLSRRNSVSIYVYFQRYAGFDDENAFVALMRTLNEKLSALGDLYLAFTQKVPVVQDVLLIAKYEAAMKRADKTATDSLVGALSGVLSPDITRSAALAGAVRQAAATIIELYKSNEPSGNMSIFSNFLIKQFCWIDKYVPALFKTAADINPKVVYFGSVKKHETYFLIFMSLLGCDVVIFDPMDAKDYSAVDKSGRFSKLVCGSVKKPLEAYPEKITGASAGRASRAAEAAVGVSVEKLPSLIVSLKASNDILSDFSAPLCERVGYVGKPAPIIPVYFYRCVGIPDDSEEAKDDYFNRLFLLDKKLKKNKNGYVKVENQLAAPSADELFELRDIELKPGEINESYIDYVLFGILKSGRLYSTGFKPLDNTIIKAFRAALVMYVDADKTVNPSKLKNFVSKFIVWLNRYVKQLYKNLDFCESPKFLYYGEIKLHEACLLTALSLSGCDVLYISPDISHGAVFRQLDKDAKFSCLEQKPFSTDYIDFPAAEKAVRQSTVAYKASEQISEIIYGADTGLFRPWQFEDYNAIPLTLKTTLDELKLLWNEQAKMRQGFKVEGGSIYIPNLFAKINGVNDDLNEYWSTVAGMSRIKNCVTLNRVPFTNVTYSNQELYSCAYLFDKNGTLNIEKVCASKFYRFGYLKTSLQLLILRKIGELMTCGNLLRQADDKFKLQILLTILTLDTSIVNLLGAFDFPSDIPKVIIYHNDMSRFSEEDAIVIGFLNLMGMDLAVFTPTNYNNLENHFKSGCFDTFQLPSVNTQLNMPDLSQFTYQSGHKTFFSRIFNK